jgi:PAS domain S-box-containing protein
MVHKHIVEGASDMICRMTTEGNFVYINKSTCSLTGYSETELMKLNFYELVREDYREYVINFYKNQIENKFHSTCLEFPLVKKDGKYIWLEQSACWEETDSQHFSMIARDITERKKIEKNLLRKSAKDMVLVENLRGGVLVEDEKRRIIVANKSFCEMFSLNYTPEELVGKYYWQISELIKRLIKDPEKFYFDEELLANERTVLTADSLELKNGNVYERDYIPIYTDEGFTGSLWKYKDITEQHKIKKELTKNEKKYRSIISTMNLGLLEVDTNGRIISGNESFCEMLSYQSIDELLGKQADETFLDQEARQVMREQMELREKGASGAYEIKIKKSNGVDSAWVLISGTPLYDDNDNVVGSLGIHLDITRQKMIEKELQETEARKRLIEAQEKAMELLEEKVAERTREVMDQKKFIEDKNHEITMSLNYALRIQQALLPDQEQVRKILPDSFILFKPKDIVSGDFYFYEVQEDRVIIAAADCTGHGVPGAFMSMLGIEKLLTAVQNVSTPGEALSLLDKSIKNSLHHSESEKSILDGLDIALCFVDLKTKVVEFAGARRPLWIIRHGSNQLTEIKGAKRDIGGWTLETEYFETHKIQLEADDSFFLFSDGYADQFGENDKRLMTKRFQEQLLSIQQLPMSHQERFLRNFLENWQGSQEQTDDILVIGVRL